ncbi:hypothetical protein, partial [Streptomyces leeuwenhoekii]
MQRLSASFGRGASTHPAGTGAGRPAARGRLLRGVALAGSLVLAAVAVPTSVVAAAPATGR